ncbi:AAA family ATPase [Algoriphagus halophytocola]|uniref:AAA family ATPase n=1 Tax=Algoriphagus halophytocola TaxID=2991499 RepID=A0ABY6MC09_9BACT|nr:AAA family ATPase [Algoriphagus sp. TR-M5]UZD21192.1 AAA family ATPase [Algoriphagus sp. TR-M5]
MTLIKNIKSLKDFGIFQNSEWKDLPEFKRFNLIYGWNRCGKTTLSRVFSSCEKKLIYHKDLFRQFPINGEFEIELFDKTSIKSKVIQNSNLEIRVFNQDFIEDNVSFEPNRSSNGIVYLSEGDIESKKKLEKLKTEKKELKAIFDLAKKNKDSKEKIKNSFLQSVGREVSNVLFDKTYNKIKVEQRIKEFGIEKIKEKEIDEIARLKLEEKVKRKVGKEISTYKNIEIKLLLFNGLDKIYEHVKILLSKKVVSETIDKLKDDEELNNWVKKGFELHKSKDEYGKCLFCDNPLPNKLFDIFSKHFSKDYIDLQNDIEFFITLAKELKFSQIPNSNSEIYPEFKDEYNLIADRLNSSIKDFNSWISSDLEGLLNQKSTNPFDNDLIDMLVEPRDFEKEINENISLLNQVILKHNQLVIGHNDEVKKSKEKLELHTIAKAIIEEDFKEMEDEYLLSIEEEQFKLQALTEIEKEIDKIENETSQIGNALKKINSYLKSYFGKDEISLGLDDSKKGYLIYRDGKTASNLSEGEKTAIAFSYFIVKTEEKDFKVSNSVVFIDDPISSLDSNFVYHSFSLIKEHFQGTRQLFISTHNFHFFNLIKEWFNLENKKVQEKNIELEKKKSELKPVPSEFFMVESYYESEKRKSELKLLDKTLKRFKSEYHFLFNNINQFLSTSPEYGDLYTIGNISRRFFEIYADFKIPNTSNPRQKMEALLKEANSNGAKISLTDLGKVYKLINEFSHNYEPLSSIEHTDKSECNEAIKTLLSIVEYSDKKHFDIMKKNCLTA